MQERPLSLTIIAWIIIIGALFSLYTGATMATNPLATRMLAQSRLPVTVHQAFVIAGSLVYLVSSFGILKGHGWSRWLYVGWSILALIFSLLTTPVVSIVVLSLLTLAVVAFFLFRPAANAWFSARAARSA